MTDLEKKILDIARKHPAFDEAKALAELKKMNDLDPDLVRNLWTLYTTKLELESEETS